MSFPIAIRAQMLRERILAQLGRKASPIARAVLRPISRTLAREMEVQLRQTSVSLYLPYHWARIVHDGRGPSFPNKSKYLAWFPNKKQDPRTSGATQYGRNKGDRPSLLDVWGPITFALATMRQKRGKNKGKGKIVFAKRSRGVPARSFFSQGPLHAFTITDAPIIIETAFGAFVDKEMVKLSKRGKVGRTVVGIIRS